MQGSTHTAQVIRYPVFIISFKDPHNLLSPTDLLMNKRGVVMIFNSSIYLNSGCLGLSSSSVLDHTMGLTSTSENIIYLRI